MELRVVAAGPKQLSWLLNHLLLLGPQPRPAPATTETPSWLHHGFPYAFPCHCHISSPLCYIRPFVRMPPSLHYCKGTAFSVH